MIIVGIDPGARETGIAVVEFDGPNPALVSSATVRREVYAEGIYLPVHQDYLDRIYTVVHEQAADLIGVENVVPPNLHMGRAAFRTDPILATAIVAGYCLSFARSVIQVPPDGNGGGPLGGYPEPLVSVREKTLKGWRFRTSGDHATLRHERSAYDVARVAHRLTYKRGNRTG